MSANLTVTNGVVEFAYAVEDGPAWHGEGQTILPEDDLKTIISKAGMGWNVEKVPHTYLWNGDLQLVDGSYELVRDDTGARLSTVSKQYHIVQPREVVEFFDSLLKDHGMRMSTAGTLNGGTRFWAMAETGETTKIGGKDPVHSKILLTSSVNGSATIALPTSVRVVCQNTLGYAMKDTTGAVRQTHRRPLDVSSMHSQLGFVSKQWDEFIHQAETLADKSVIDTFASEFFASLFEVDGELSKTDDMRIEELMHLYKNGKGAEYSYGTAWGILNAVTERFTHGSTVKQRGKRKASSVQFWDSLTGSDAKIKTDAFNYLLAA